MIDCSKKAFLRYCTHKEIAHLPKIEFLAYGNAFSFYDSFTDNKFNEWIKNMLSLEPTHSIQVLFKLDLDIVYFFN